MNQSYDEALHGLDAGRRAGWAKYYAAQERIAELEAEVRELQELRENAFQEQCAAVDGAIRFWEAYDAPTRAAAWRIGRKIVGEDLWAVWVSEEEHDPGCHSL